MIDSIFGFFAVAWVPWALSGVLIGGAVGVWLHLRWRLRPVVRGLADARRVIEETPGPAAFRERFSTINQRLSGNRVIGDTWQAFAQTIVPVPGQDNQLGATRRPSEDFNEGVLTGAGINLRFYVAVPNYLVGLGLLFTFLGLVAALYFASAGVTAAKVAEAQGALRDLLTAATFKFVTSIAGLGASIVYSWREKELLYQVTREFGRLCTTLEQRLISVTPEYLEVVQLDELRTQTTLLRRLGRNLHVTVPDTVEERLAAELIDAVQPLRAGFVKAAERFAELDGEVVARMVAGATPSAAATDPAKAAGTVDERTMDSLVGELRRLRDALEGLPALVPGVGSPARVNASPGDTNLARALPAFAQLFESSAHSVEALDGQLEASLERITTSLRGLHVVDSAGPQLETSMASIAKVRRDLEDLGRAFREVATSSRALLEAHHARSEGADPALVEALDQLGRQVQRFNERVRSFVGRADEELARSSSLLSSIASGGEAGTR